MSAPAVSIIVPIYNGEKFLREALSSVRNQTYVDWECLCINDGGDDSSSLIVEEFARQDKRFIRIEKANEGVAATRNYGLGHATGQYVALLDQDDVLHSRFLEVAVSAMEEAKADVLSVGIKTVHDDSIDAFSSIGESHVRTDEDILASWLDALPKLGFANINVWGKLYRRAALDSVRFPNGVFGADDYVFTIRLMLKRGRWAFVDDADLYFYRMHPENITSKMPPKYVCGVLESSMLAHRDIQENGRLSPRQKDLYYRADSKRILSWAIKKSVRNGYAGEDVARIRERLLAARRSGALRFYSFRDWLKFYFFIRGYMDLLKIVFPKLKKQGWTNTGGEWNGKQIGGAIKVTVVTVARNIAFYRRCVSENPCLRGANFVCYDNNAENMAIPSRYNAFINEYDYSQESWFVFCHEDFYVCEPFLNRIKELPINAIYGVCGQSLAHGNLGYQLNSKKDGTQLEFRGIPIYKPTTVDTLDCCCLIVHSSLCKRYDLRFDEKLSWDLYTEDFCIGASERHGIDTKVIPLKSCHYSYGKIVPRFFSQLAYLRDKYRAAKRVYATATAYSIGGDPKCLPSVDAMLRCQQRSWFRYIFYRKYTHTGRLLVKVLGIPILNRQKYNVDDWLGGRK